MAVDAEGVVYVADTGNGRIRTLDRDGTLTTVAGTGEQGFGGDGAAATAARFDHPSSVAVGADGTVYVADTGNQRVRAFRPGRTVATIAGNGTYDFAGDGGPAVEAGFRTPIAVAAGPDGVVYVTDLENNRIRAVDATGRIRTVAGSDTTVGFAGDGGRATAARLARPHGLAVGGDGTLFIADTQNHRIRAVGPDGVIRTVAGNGLDTSAGDGGPATEASLDFPDAVAVGTDGDLYIAETGGFRVRVVHTDGIIDTVAGTGERGAGGDDGPPAAGTFAHLEGIAIAVDDSLYLADLENHRIRAFRV